MQFLVGTSDDLGGHAPDCLGVLRTSDPGQWQEPEEDVRLAEDADMAFVTDSMELGSQDNEAVAAIVAIAAAGPVTDVHCYGAVGHQHHIPLVVFRAQPIW